MSHCPSIAEHGLIGDLHTSALVSTAGTIDWFCAPRFDSPSIFGSLLDSRRGGHFSIRPLADEVTTKQLYLPDTAILITRFLTEAGVGEVVDFMPMHTGTESSSHHRLVRMVHCVRGEMTFVGELAPRFDYGRVPHCVVPGAGGAVFSSPAGSLTLHIVREPEDEALAEVRLDDHGDLHARATLRAGQVRGMVLETGPETPPRQIRVAEIERLFADAADFWSSWLARSTYDR